MSNSFAKGRADSQIKIRGFRIELGEIDTHLGAHPGVRENVTLVRRDKDEEKMLVSYIVPVRGWTAASGQGMLFLNLGEETSADATLMALGVGDTDAEDEDKGGLEGGIRRYAALLKDIRAHLKKKLPGYSVPTCELF